CSLGSLLGRARGPIHEAVGLGERDDELTHVEARGLEGGVELLEGALVLLALEASGGEPEPLTSDARLRLGALRDLLRELDGAVEPPYVVSEHLSRRVDRPALIDGAVLADRVVVLEPEADRIERRVAAGAGGVGRVLGEALARRLSLL